MCSNEESFCLAALEAMVAGVPDGARGIPASEFFTGTWSTALADDEVLVATRFPVWDGRVGFGFGEVARRSGDFALAGVAAAVELSDDDRITRSAVGLFGVSSMPVRAIADRDRDHRAAGRGRHGEGRGARPVRPTSTPLPTCTPPGRTAARVAAHLMETALDAAIEEARRVGA